jgi:hypothetical protein
MCHRDFREVKPCLPKARKNDFDSSGVAHVNEKIVFIFENESTPMVYSEKINNV